MQNERVSLANHTLLFRVHPRVFPTLFVALAVVVKILTALLP